MPLILLSKLVFPKRKGVKIQYKESITQMLSLLMGKKKSNVINFSLKERKETIICYDKFGKINIS